MVDQGDILVLVALTHQAIVVTQVQVQAIHRAMEAIQAVVTELQVDLAPAVKGHQLGQAAALRLDQTPTRELTHRLHLLYLVTTHIMMQH